MTIRFILVEPILVKIACNEVIKISNNQKEKYASLNFNQQLIVSYMGNSQLANEEQETDPLTKLPEIELDQFSSDTTDKDEILDFPQIQSRSDSFDSTWLSFVELCDFLVKKVKSVEIIDSESQSLDHDDIIALNGSKSALSPERYPKEIRLILEKDSKLSDSNIIISKIVRILKCLVLRELFVGVREIPSGAKNDSTSATMDENEITKKARSSREVLLVITT